MPENIILNVELPLPTLPEDNDLAAFEFEDGVDDVAPVAAEEQESLAVAVKKKLSGVKFAAVDYYDGHQSKTPSPGNLPRDLLVKRALRIKVSKNHGERDRSTCLQCNCNYRDHNQKGNCLRCGACTGYIYQEQIGRVQFTEFMRWTRRWIKAGKKRDVTRFREIWSRFQNIGKLHYCAGCDTPTFTNDVRSVAKRQDSLSCATCSQCSSCCKCITCTGCHYRKRDNCKKCNVCRKCCTCANCPVCNRDASLNYCGFAYTDAMKRHDRGCTRCYKCCDCGDRKRVPFGSFAKPNFHKPTLLQRTKNPSSRYISTEIEVAGIHGHGKPIYETVRKWGGATVGDGSLNLYGFEINSAPAGGDLYVQQVEEMCAVIHQEKGFIDEKCGLHIHVDARDMDYYSIRRFVRAYAAIEDALFAMVSPQRLAGVMDDQGKLHQYCQPCGKKYIAAIEEGRLPYEKIKADVISSVYSGPSTQNLRYRKRGQGIPRYNALNLHSWFYRGTIEARMFDGCIDPQPIIKWGIMWALIADYVVKNTDDQVAKDMSSKPLACLRKIIGNNQNIIDFVRERVLMYGTEPMKREVKDLF